MRPQRVVLTTLQGPLLTMSLLSGDLAVAYGSQGQSVDGGNGTDARCVPMVAGLLRYFLIPRSGHFWVPSRPPFID